MKSKMKSKWNCNRAKNEHGLFFYFQDITQQHLCDESSVDLIEKCTRYNRFAFAYVIKTNATPLRTMLCGAEKRL